MKASLLLLLAAALAAPLAAEDAATTPAPAAPAAAPAVAPAKAALVAVENIAIGTAVEERVLQGAAASFPASTGRVYCHHRTKTTVAPTTIRHVWSKDGEVRGEITLNVGGDGWRTWSNHAIEPGSWKVDVLDADGTLADSVLFTVTE